jgi:hypothetical protein
MKSRKDAQHSGTPVRPEHEPGRLSVRTDGRGELDRAGFIKTRSAGADSHSNETAGSLLAARTETCAAATAALARDEATCAALRDLLIANGRLCSALDVMTILPIAMEWMLSVVSDVLHSALPEIVASTGDHTRLRSFFLDSSDSYSIEDLAALWQISTEDVRAIYHDEIHSWAGEHPGDPDSLRIAWADAMGASFALNLLRPYFVEIALGADYPPLQSEQWRTVPILIRLPRFIAESIAGLSPVPGNAGLADHVEHFVLELFQAEFRSAFMRTRA